MHIYIPKVDRLSAISVANGGTAVDKIDCSER